MLTNRALTVPFSVAMLVRQASIFYYWLSASLKVPALPQMFPVTSLGMSRAVHGLKEKSRSFTNEEFSLLRAWVKALEEQVKFLYKHLDVTFEPESAVSEDPRIIEQIKKGKVLDAIKIHREIYGTSLPEAKKALEDLMALIGVS